MNNDKKNHLKSHYRRCILHIRKPETCICKKVLVNFGNDYNSYRKFLKLKYGTLLNYKGEIWAVEKVEGYYSKHKKKTNYQRSMNYMSHPLNNETHFYR